LNPYSPVSDCPPERWDAFLESIPEGHFQQSSMWAEAKTIEGWEPILVTFERDGQIRGGFQILTKHTRFGRIGYVSKGPALADEHPDLQAQALKSLADTSRKHGLRALIVQAPDHTRLTPGQFRELGFLPNHLINVISATLVIDVGRSREEILAQMRRTTMLELKRAQKRGIKIREAGQNDLGTFFDLMVETCKRQETSPSPASVPAFQKLWEAFGDRLRLTLAEFEGQPVAGTVCLCFGDRVTFWKKGWSGAHRDKHPNQMVMFEAIEWSQQHGYKRFDCAGMSRDTAESLVHGRRLSELQKTGRDFFLLGYGGAPVLLPESWVLIPNPLSRLVYRVAGGRPGFSQITRRMAQA